MLFYSLFKGENTYMLAGLSEKSEEVKEEMKKDGEDMKLLMSEKSEEVKEEMKKEAK